MDLKGPLFRLPDELREVWCYKDFIISTIARDFQARYRNSVIGIGWTILNPLAMIVIYTLIFSQVMQSRLPGSQLPFAYSIFLMAGILPWGLFAEMLARSPSVFIDNAHLIKKVSLPKLCFPLIILGNSLLNFAIIFSLFLLVLLVIGQFPGWVFLALIPILLLQLFLAFGIGLCLAILNVFFRDVGQFFSIFLQFWFWLTPIVYSLQMIPQNLQGLWQLNPMLSIIVAYQGIFLEQQWPNWSSLLPVMIFALVMNGMSLRLLSNHGADMADEL
jgi:lipopolysaccharide transport system permease protein